MPRGSKTCKQCGTTTGPRAYECKVCGASFNIQSTTLIRQSQGTKVHWTDLEQGDFIKVLSGSGPYWPLANGERVSMGYGGKFRVQSLTRTGIHAYPADKKNSGHCFIYMGPKVMSAIGMFNRSHKIRKLTKRPKITNPSMKDR